MGINQIRYNGSNSFLDLKFTSVVKVAAADKYDKNVLYIKTDNFDSFEVNEIVEVDLFKDAVLNGEATVQKGWAIGSSKFYIESMTKNDGFAELQLIHLKDEEETTDQFKSFSGSAITLPNEKRESYQPNEFVSMKWYQTHELYEDPQETLDKHL